jgi:hypothetical protein
MHSIGWREVDYTAMPGIRQVRDFTIMLLPEHIARWKEDPDGRFEVKSSANQNALAALGQFYPSL